MLSVAVGRVFCAKPAGQRGGFMRVVLAVDRCTWC